MYRGKIKEGQLNDINFQLGMYFRKKADFKSSEKYLRYAAHSGNPKAVKKLHSKNDKTFYLNEDERINLAAIEILEQLVTPLPSENEIEILEGAITKALSSIINRKK